MVQEQAVPQLNLAETEEMKQFLVWLMKDDGNEFQVMSVTTFAVADSLRRVGVYLSTDGKQRYEAPPLVSYVSDQASGASHISTHH